MSAKNREGDTHDRTDHAERVLAGIVSGKFSQQELNDTILYTNAEPCAMCAGAIYWSGIGTVVYAISEKKLHELTGNDDRNPTMDVPCRTVFKGCQRKIDVIGPFPEIEKQALEPHKGFWNK